MDFICLTLPALPRPIVGREAPAFGALPMRQRSFDDPRKVPEEHLNMRKYPKVA